MIRKNAKYLHIIWHPDLKFIPKLIKMINEEDSYFNLEEHIFITPHKKVYDEMSKKYEIYLCGNEQENLINKYGEYGQWIFVHAINCSKLKLILTKNKYAKKVIWRTWGHDIRPLEYYNYRGIKKILFHFIWKAYIEKVHRFHMIGVANDIDLVNVNNTFGEMDSCILGYGYDPIKDNLLDKLKNNIENRKEKSLRILIGHSASKWDDYISVMKKLIQYRNYDITICLILSYAGEREYVDEVKKFAKENFGEKIEIIDCFMEYEKYINYLNSIDIAIFAQKHSTALSNISWLLHFGKTIYFREDSDFAKSFKRKKCEFCKVEEIEKMTFEQFKTKRNSKELMNEYGIIPTSKDCCENWKKVLDKLSEEEI